MLCRRCELKLRGRERGAALVVAMLVFAVSASLVVAMQDDFMRFFQRSANILMAEQAHAYLRGAEELAGMALLYDYDQDKTNETPRDDLGEVWAKPPQPYAIDDGGWMIGKMEDLQGRFNLNALARRVEREDGKRVFTPAQAQFIRLLQALGEPEISEYEAILITAAVTDWLDADRNPVPDGAEDDYYYGRDPAYRTANRPMASPSELLAVANMTPEIYQALLPWITVWPETAEPLNIHTAPAMILRTINVPDDLSPLSEADGESLASYREEEGFADIKDFLANPVFEGKDKQKLQELARGGLLGQSTSYFLLSAELELADRNMRLYSVLQRRDRRISALARASGSL
jgi:general secretion pathway protein K